MAPHNNRPMADTLVAPRPRPFNANISTTHRDVSDNRYRDLRRPRKVRFYANGNRYFKGKKLFVTPHRYLSFNDLLNDLTSKLPHSVQLPYGVRQIFTPVTGRRIRDIEELEDGKQYVCGGFETFRSIKYGSTELEPWSVGQTKGRHEFFEDQSDAHFPGSNQMSNSYGRGYYGAFQPSRTLRNSYPATRKPYGSLGGHGGYSTYWGQNASQDPSLHTKPKVITVVRNGPTPHPDIKILLNRRSVQSFEQLMKDVSEAFGPQFKNNKVRKLFTVKGREVQGVSDFFRDDEIFIAVGSESLTTGDVQDILREIYPDSSYPKVLMKEWEKTKRRYQQPTYSYKLKDVAEERDDSKRDSGLGSDASKDEPTEKDDIIYKGKANEHSKQKKVKKPHYAQPKEENTVEEDDDLATRIARDRMHAVEEEREKARRRAQKRLDAERRALDEERRKRGLIPLKPLTERKQPDNFRESPERYRKKKKVPTATLR